MNMVVSIIPASVAIAIMRRAISAVSGTMTGVLPNYIDRLSLTLLCQSLGVSKSAAIIRLRQLGYIEDRPFAEYDDPLEVWL